MSKQEFIMSARRHGKSHAKLMSMIEAYRGARNDAACLLALVDKLSASHQLEDHETIMVEAIRKSLAGDA